MPCNCDYMDPNMIEEEMSIVACIHDELDGVKICPSSPRWKGYHPRVYTKSLTKQQCDKMVTNLCSRLQNIDVSKLSLEAQIWWRDHLEADINRTKLISAQEDKVALLNRLTPYERQLLGYS